MDGFIWWPERGMGYFPVQAADVYDQAYFEKYQDYAQTARGQALTEARMALVRRWIGQAALVDVGIGCGHFIQQRGGLTRGTDINPAALTWLRTHGLYCDLRGEQTPAASFWDSLEHLPHPALVLAQITRWAFMSLPIFRDREHVLRSKHFRPDEHYWYWTEPGLQAWMWQQGFVMRERNDMESQLGREDILTFVFERVRAIQ